MYSFSYQFKGESHIANVLPDKSNSSLKYKVILPEGVEFIIVSVGMRNAEGNIIWSQSLKSGEIIQPPDFVQAVGEGIEYRFKKTNYKILFRGVIFFSLAITLVLWLIGANILLPIMGKCHKAVIIKKYVSHGIRIHTYTLAYGFSMDG